MCFNISCKTTILWKVGVVRMDFQLSHGTSRLLGSVTIGHNEGENEILGHPIPQPKLCLKHFCTFCPREVWTGFFHFSLLYLWAKSLWRSLDGNPFQYSCLENPMVGGAWWATVHGVAKNDFIFASVCFTIALCVHLHIRINSISNLDLEARE